MRDRDIIWLWVWYSEKATISLFCNRCGFDPWVRKIPWWRKWQSTPVFLPEKSYGQGAWWATVQSLRVGHNWTWVQDKWVFVLKSPKKFMTFSFYCSNLKACLILLFRTKTTEDRHDTLHIFAISWYLKKSWHRVYILRIVKWMTECLLSCIGSGFSVG